ncbi:hypothetical protein Hanom_Chr00s002586g01701741 [Helianthus anomalus]
MSSQSFSNQPSLNSKQCRLQSYTSLFIFFYLRSKNYHGADITTIKSLVSTPPTVEDVRLWGMGRGLGRGLGTNAHVTTPGGLGFRRGPLGWGFSPGVGRGYGHYIAEPRWPRALAL